MKRSLPGGMPLACIFFLFFSSNLFAQLPSYLPANGLVAWYPFNGNANDESGNGNNGVVNGATLTTDRVGASNRAYLFNSNSINLGNSPQFSISNNGFSVSIWVNKSTESNLWHAIGKRITCDGADFQYQIASNVSPEGVVWGGITPGENSIINSNIFINPNQWYLLVGTFDGSSWKLYINGDLISSLTSPLTDHVNANLIVGNSGTCNGFIGKLDDIAIYNRALSAAEVTALYTTTPTNTGGGTTTTTTAPPGIPYQAEVRNDNGEVLANANVNVRFTLHELTANGTVSYQETHAISTNELGLFAATIGAGTAAQGTFAGINWSQTTKFLQVEVDTGNGYITMGNQQLMSVPYALYAANGPQGPQGPQGPVGPQGPAGERGPQGDSGSNNGYIHYIGEYYSGGYIFSLWKDSFDVEHGLIVSPFNAGVATYQTYYNNDAGPNSLNLYSGIENTYAILNNDISMPNPGGFTNAAYLCDTYTNDGYTDWYLPSIKELEELGRSNLIIYQASNGVSHLAAAGGIIQFWSSTQFSNSESYAYTVLGGITTSWKANNNLVRPIRKF